MKRNFIIIISCILATVLGFTVYHFIPKQAAEAEKEIIQVQSTYPSKSKTDLINDADLIIKGKVNKILPGKWSNPDNTKTGVQNIIQTDILIDIDEVYKGTPYDKKTIDVRIDKGSAGNTIWIDESFPDFTPFEEVILFLSIAEGDLAIPVDNYYILTGAFQGKFSISEKFDTDKIFKNEFNKDTFRLSSVKKEITDTLEYLKLN